MSEELAVKNGFADDPRKVGLLLSSDLGSSEPPVVIASLLALTDDTIVVGTTHPDDIFRTTFDRFLGLAIDEGKLAPYVVCPSELARIEGFAAKGAYLSTPAPASTAVDVDDMMG